jgi:hypothetical protein
MLTGGSNVSAKPFLHTRQAGSVNLILNLKQVMHFRASMIQHYFYLTSNHLFLNITM